MHTFLLINSSVRLESAPYQECPRNVPGRRVLETSHFFNCSDLNKHCELDKLELTGFC